MSYLRSPPGNGSYGNNLDDAYDDDEESSLKGGRRKGDSNSKRPWTREVGSSNWWLEP